MKTLLRFSALALLVVITACGTQRANHNWEGSNSGASAPMSGVGLISWQNPANRLDVNGDGVVTREDFDILKEEIEESGTYAIPLGVEPTLFLDVDGNGIIDKRDTYELSAIFTAWHRVQNPYDVNGDGQITTDDADLVLLYISQYGYQTVVGDYAAPPSSGNMYDVNGDNRVTPLDALNILNYLSRAGN